MAGPTHKKVKRDYVRTTVVVFAIYSVLCFAAPAALDLGAVAGATGAAGAGLRFLIGVSPAIPLAVWFYFLRGVYDRLDEVHRDVASRAAIATAGVTLTFATGYGFLEMNLDYPHFPLFFIYHVMLGTFCVAYPVILRRMTA